MIPQTQEKRQKLYSYITEVVETLTQIDELKSDIDNVKDIAVEEFGVTKADLNIMIKVEYDRSRVDKEIEDRQTAVSNVEILKGVSKGE